jgi:hypothetical protein
MKKIPYSGDLTPIEQAVWAAEYVRVRASFATQSTRADVITTAIGEANDAVAELKERR